MASPADDAELLFQRAQNLRARGRLAPAAAAFERASILRPGHLPTCLHWSETLMRQGRLARMSAILTAALERGSLTASGTVSDLLLRYRLAAVAGDFAEAERLGESVLDLTRDLPHLETLAWPVLVENYSRLDKPAAYLRKMDRDLDRFVAARPRSPWGRYLRLYLTNRMMERRPSVRTDGRFLCTLDAKRYGWMRYEAGTFGLHTGDPRRALADFTAAELCSTPPNWRARCRIADVRLTMGDAAGARASLRRAEMIAGPRKKGAVLAHKSGVLLLLGDYRGALQAVTAAVAAGARNFPHWHRGAALLKLGRRGEALKALDEALAKEPEDEVARLWRAEALLRLGRRAQAAVESDRVLRENPGNAYALILRGLAGTPAAARRALRLIPPNMRRRARLRGLDDRGTLERILVLSRGLRKHGYLSAFWMSRP